MRYRFLLCFFLSVPFLLPAQTPSDTGMPPDTVAARRWLEEGKSLIGKRAYPEAGEKIDAALTVFRKAGHLPGIGEALHHLGRVHTFLFQPDSAIARYREAIDVRTAAYGPEHASVAQSLNNLATVCSDKRLYDDAIEYHRQAIAIWERIYNPRHGKVADSYLNLGNVYLSKKQYPQAMDYFRKALDIWEALDEQPYLKMSFAHGNIGNSYLGAGQYPEALKAFHAALSMVQAIANPDPLELGRCYNNLGMGYLSMGNLDVAVKYFQMALDRYQPVLKRKHPIIAKILTNTAVCYDGMGRRSEAIELEQQSLNIRQEIFGANHPEVALSFERLGTYHAGKGRYELGIQHLLKALDIRLAVFGPEHPVIGDACHNLAAMYVNSGQYDRAIEYNQKALVLQEVHLGTEHPRVASTYDNLGLCYQGKKQYAEAIRHHRKALDISTKVLPAEHPDIAIVCRGLSLSCQESGDTAAGNAFLKKALAIFEKSGPAYNGHIVQCLNNQAQYFQDYMQYDSAVVYFNKALSRLRYDKDRLDAATDPNLLRKVLARFGHCLYARYRSAGQRAHLDSAYAVWSTVPRLIDHIQALDRELEPADREALQELPMFEFPIAVCHELARSTNDAGYHREAFGYAEQSKSLLLAMAMQESEARSFSRIPDSLLRVESGYRAAIGWCETRRQALLDQGRSETDTAVLALSAQRFDLRRGYEALKRRFETEFPDYYRLKFDRTTVSLRYVQDSLLHTDQTLLEYVTGDSAVYLFAVTADTFAVWAIKKDFPLEDWVRQLRYGLTGYFAAGANSQVLLNKTAKDYAGAAWRLYAKLVAPAASLLREHLIVVPDGVLGYIPFDVLLEQAPRVPARFRGHDYLGKKHRISYTYSATLLREMRDKKHRRQPAESILALAPFFRGDTTALLEKVDSLSALLALRSDTLAPLMHSGEEALMAARFFGGNALLGDRATKQALETLGGNYRVLLLSTHGKANDRAGEYAYLALSAPGDTFHFEKLYVKDIYNLELQADLVILSACETGIGPLQRGEGIISLARAFAYAGAKSIVTTLWSVDDAGTSQLMQQFLDALRTGHPKDEALWLAKQAFLSENADEFYAHPFYWAGFIPIGDMRMMMQKE